MRSTECEAGSGTGTQSIQRAMLLLRLITTHNRTGLRMIDLHRKAHLERPTVHRILQSLVSENLVAQDQVSKRYHLGPFAYELGLAASPRLQLRDLCRGYLKELSTKCGDNVFLTARSQLDGLCLDRIEGGHMVKVFLVEIGRRQPLGIGSGGVAILSALPAAEQDRILRTNLQRLESLYPRYSEAKVRLAIARAQRQGYVLQDVVEVPGVRSLAMPVRDASGEAIAAITMSSIAQRLEGPRVADVADAMAYAVRMIEDELKAFSMDSPFPPFIDDPK